MNALIKKLEQVQIECGTGSKSAMRKEGLDDFMRNKVEIAETLQECREELKRRDDLLELYGDCPETATVSAQIRSRMDVVRSKYQTMCEYQEAQRRKIRNPSQEQEEALRHRDDIIDIIQLHVREVDEFDRRRFRRGEQRGGALAPGSGRIASGYAPPEGGDDPTMTSLEPIDVETVDALQRLQENDDIIMQDVVEIGEGVVELKMIALAAGQELDLQNDLLSKQEVEVDKAITHVRKSTRRLNEIMEKVEKDKFVTYFICVCILLAIILFIWNLTRTKDVPVRLGTNSALVTPSPSP